MTQSINRNQLNESLSALVDDEASELEIHRVLTESQQDASVRERWHRYQMARAALQGDAVDRATTEFADGIRDAVAQIEFDEAPRGNAGSGAAPSRWRANAGRAVIAASVAAAVLVGSQQMNWVAFDSSTPDDIAQQPAQSAPAAPSAINVPTINVQNVSGGNTGAQRSRLPQSLQYSPTAQQQQLQDERIRRYIRQLMLEHAEHSAQNSGSGLLPYARVPADEEQ